MVGVSQAVDVDESEISDDPTPQMEAEQESVLVTALQSMTDADVEIVETLATDGGDRHPEELAEAADVGLSTIYRALQRLDGVLENAGAAVRFTSRKIADEVQGIVESQEYRIKNAAERVEALLGMETRQAASGAFQAWLNRYGAEVAIDDQGNDETLRVRVETILSRIKSTSSPRLEDVVDELVDAWTADGRRLDEILQATVEYRTGPDSTAIAYVSALR